MHKTNKTVVFIGVVVVHPDNPGLDISKEEFFREMLANRNGIVRYMWKNEGENNLREKYAVYRTLNNGWILAISIYSSDLTKGIGIISKIMWIIIPLVTLFGSVLSWMLTRRITRPIEILLGVMHRAAEGDLSHCAGIDSRDEMGLLARAVESARRGMLDIIDAMNRGSSYLAASSQQMASLAEAQNQNLIQVSSTAEKMAASIQEASFSLESITRGGEEASCRGNEKKG